MSVVVLSRLSFIISSDSLRRALPNFILILFSLLLYLRSNAYPFIYIFFPKINVVWENICKAICITRIEDSDLVFHCVFRNKVADPHIFVYTKYCENLNITCNCNWKRSIETRYYFYFHSFFRIFASPLNISFSLSIYTASDDIYLVQLYSYIYIYINTNIYN